MIIFSPQHMTISTNNFFHSQLIYSFIHTLRQHSMLISFSISDLYLTHCSHHGSLCPLLNSNLAFLQAPHFISIQYCWPYIILVYRPFRLYRQFSTIPQLTALPELNPPTSCSGSHNSLSSCTCTHLATRYVNYLTVFTILYDFSSCSSTCSIFLSHFLHAKFLKSILVTSIMYITTMQKSRAN